ncbi:hypothetical protein HLB23_24985 [Nocardia uniformis]|uniref:Uncharacterized protein n=1 Tax=Nocardia uniformis TaxID=53432 RepID=A0A849CAU8_9NOCA|nr:hypothetical protein [Nocardia uniformis]NNH73077.1 hypothetical protein [Nocardia uniformis]
MPQTPHSPESATAYVIAALEAKGTASRDDFDVSAIVARTHALSETWDFDSVHSETFWKIAAVHLKL